MLQRVLFYLSTLVCVALFLSSCERKPQETPPVIPQQAANLNYHHPIFPAAKIDNRFYRGNYYFASDFDMSKITIESMLRLAANQRYGNNQASVTNHIDPMELLFQQSTASSPSNDLNQNRLLWITNDEFTNNLHNATYASNYTLIGLKDIEASLLRITPEFFSSDNQRRLQIFQSMNVYFDYIFAEYRYLKAHTNADWQTLMARNNVEINFDTANFPEFLQQYNTECQLGSFNIDVNFVQRAVGNLNQYYLQELDKMNTLMEQTCQVVNIFLQLASLPDYPEAAQANAVVANEYASLNLNGQINHRYFGFNIASAFTPNNLKQALINAAVHNNPQVVEIYNDYVTNTIDDPQTKIILNFESIYAPITLSDTFNSNSGISLKVPSDPNTTQDTNSDK